MRALAHILLWPALIALALLLRLGLTGEYPPAQGGSWGWQREAACAAILAGLGATLFIASAVASRRRRG